MRFSRPKGSSRASVAAPSLRPVFFLVGKLLLAAATLMLLPLSVDLAYGNPDWRAFALASLVAAMSGFALNWWCDCRIAAGLELKQAFLLTPISWLAIATVDRLFALGEQAVLERRGALERALEPREIHDVHADADDHLDSPATTS